MYNFMHFLKDKERHLAIVILYLFAGEDPEIHKESFEDSLLVTHARQLIIMQMTSHELADNVARSLWSQVVITPVTPGTLLLIFIIHGESGNMQGHWSLLLSFLKNQPRPSCCAKDFNLY